MINGLWGGNIVGIVVRQIPVYQQAVALTKAASEKGLFDNAVTTKRLFEPFAKPIPAEEWTSTGKTPLWQRSLKFVDLVLGTILHFAIWPIQLLWKGVGILAGGIAWACAAFASLGYRAFVATAGLNVTVEDATAANGVEL